MRLRFETFFRGYWVVLGALLIWAVWASAQPAPTPTTNAAPASTSAPAAEPAGVSDTMVHQLTGLNEDILTFGLKNVPWLDRVTWLNEPLWKYLASLIYVFLAFYVSKALDWLTRVVLKRWTARTSTPLDDLVLDLFNGPIKVVSFVILLHVGLNLFRWPPWVQTFISNGLKLVVAGSLTYLALKLVDLLLGMWQQRSQEKKDEQFHRQLFPIIRRSLKVFVLIVAFLVTAPHLGLNITGVIASLSIGGLAIGLAAQDTLANLFGAVAVLVDKPFHVGDRIQLEAVDGVVESIGFRSTQVRNLDGHLVSIPNKTVGAATITNVTRRPNIRTLINIGITYDCDRAKIQQGLDLLQQIYGSHPNTQDVWISFNKFADFSLNLYVIHWWNNTDYKAYLQGMQELNLAIKERFDAAGIGFAFPTQTLHVKQDSEWRLAGGTGGRSPGDEAP